MARTHMVPGGELSPSCTEMKWRQYAGLVAAIQHVMLAVIAATRSRRAEMLRGLSAGTRNKNKLIHAVTPHVGSKGSTKRVRRGATLDDPQHGRHPQGWRASVARYVESVEWALLEVLIDFELVAGERVRRADFLQLDSVRLLRNEGSLS